MDAAGNISRVNNLDLKDKYLRLKKRSVKKLISLPPKYLGNISKGIDDAIFKTNQENFKELNWIV